MLRPRVEPSSRRRHQQPPVGAVCRDCRCVPMPSKTPLRYACYAPLDQRGLSQASAIIQRFLQLLRPQAHCRRNRQGTDLRQKAFELGAKDVITRLASRLSAPCLVCRHPVLHWSKPAASCRRPLSFPLKERELRTPSPNGWMAPTDSKTTADGGVRFSNPDARQKFLCRVGGGATAGTNRLSWRYRLSPTITPFGGWFLVDQKRRPSQTIGGRKPHSRSSRAGPRVLSSPRGGR